CGPDGVAGAFRLIFQSRHPCLKSIRRTRSDLPRRMFFDLCALWLILWMTAFQKLSLADRQLFCALRRLLFPGSSDRPIPTFCRKEHKVYMDHADRKCAEIQRRERSCEF